MNECLCNNDDVVHTLMIICIRKKARAICLLDLASGLQLFQLVKQSRNVRNNNCYRERKRHEEMEREREKKITLLININSSLSLVGHNFLYIIHGLYLLLMFQYTSCFVCVCVCMFASILWLCYAGRFLFDDRQSMMILLLLFFFIRLLALSITENTCTSHIYIHEAWVERKGWRVQSRRIIEK